MNKHNLHKSATKNFCFQTIIYHAFIFPTDIRLHVTTGELDWVTFNQNGKPHKTKKF